MKNYRLIIIGSFFLLLKIGRIVKEMKKNKLLLVFSLRRLKSKWEIKRILQRIWLSTVTLFK